MGNSLAALLRLKGVNGSCAEETQFVRTACMPDVTMPDGSECTISGWGATEDCERDFVIQFRCNAFYCSQHVPFNIQINNSKQIKNLELLI